MKRLLVFIVIILLAAILGLGVVVFVVLKDKEPDQLNQTVAVMAPEATPTVKFDQLTPGLSSLSIGPALTAEEQEAQELKDWTAAFLERYGTYSAQTAWSQLNGLKLFMTEPFYVWASQGLAAQGITKSDESLYYGRTTQVLSLENKSLDLTAGQAEFLVKTQRSEFRGTAHNAKIYPQTARVKLIKDNELWLFSGVWWE